MVNFERPFSFPPSNRKGRARGKGTKKYNAKIIITYVSKSTECTKPHKK